MSKLLVDLKFSEELSLRCRAVYKRLFSFEKVYGELADALETMGEK
jgi:hypothetical protein